ncbi:hypothetical protein BH10PLA2_BH10PLA2_09720 [soil metagenome]
MKQNKMAAVRVLLGTNPDITPDEIVAALAKQKIQITTGVASNYKSVIKSGAKRGKKKGRKAAGRVASIESIPTLAAPVKVTSNGSHASGLEPSLVELLKAGQSLGWEKVRSIADLMVD